MEYDEKIYAWVCVLLVSGGCMQIYAQNVTYILSTTEGAGE
jgi:hypothetical protein